MFNSPPICSTVTAAILFHLSVKESKHAFYVQLPPPYFYRPDQINGTELAWHGSVTKYHHMEHVKAQLATRAFN